MKEIQQTVEQVGRLTEFGRQYIEEKIYLTKLEAAEKIVQITSEITSKAILSVFCFFAIFFFEGAMAMLLIDLMDSALYPLLIISGFNLFCALIVIRFKRKLITNSILPYFIKLIFKEL